MAHYLITGAAGFIGSKVTQQLLDAGHRVTAVDNLNDAYDQRMKHWRLSQLSTGSELVFHQQDISDFEAMRELWRAAEPFDAVINLAARAGVRQSVENPWIYETTNATGTLNLLELCRREGVNKFVLASTSSLYGCGAKMPFQEQMDTSRPLSPYAASKKAAESLAYSYHHLHGIDVTVFRYFTVYGPAGRPDMSPFRFVQWISEGRPVIVYGDGGQSRDFTYVDDIARGTILGLNLSGYRVINLGSDRPIVLMDMIRMVEDHVGLKASLEFKPIDRSDMSSTWADISRAKQELGWSPETPFEEGIENTVRWYRNNRAWASKVATL